MIAVASRTPEPLPADTESRLAEFSRIAAMAVANAKSRAELAESRARIVRTSDEARRRFERDLHDGAQQRLVSMGFELREAEAMVPPELGDLHHTLEQLDAGLNDVVDDLRELSQGLHPAVLSEGGLVPALRALARRSAVPIELQLAIDDGRLEEALEVTAYYVTSEALTNAAKHAHATRVEIAASERAGWLELTVRDDGRGGADPSGTGITGLVDRVEAVGGVIHVESPPNAGTTVEVKLPIKKGE
jgi:signal transduction histidine kinase